MSINLWTTGDLFTVRIYKRLAGRQDLAWANTYELQVNTAGDGAGVDAAQEVVNTLGNFEASFHLDDVRFDRGVFSTLVPDGQPYDPDTFASYSLTSVTGQRAASNPLSLQNCFLARKNVQFGRAGRFLYRRCLSEEEVNAVSGDPVLNPNAQLTLNGLLNAAIGDFNLIETLQQLGASLVMAGVAGGVTRVRSVESLSAAGVTVKAYNNRYFDRA